MGWLVDRVPTLADMQQTRRAPQKGIPRVIERKEKQRLQSEIEDDFRRGVQKRDGMKSRASGKRLLRNALDADSRCEVHHVLKRSTHPQGRWEIARGILLSRTEHKMAETRCPQAPDHFLLEITGPDDLGERQQFTWRDKSGAITKTRTG